MDLERSFDEEALRYQLFVFAAVVDYWLQEQAAPVADAGEEGAYNSDDLASYVGRYFDCA